MVRLYFAERFEPVSLGDSVQLELIKTGFGCLLLALGWFVGQRIIAFWDIRKKRQEIDFETAKQFHQLYGEFKEVSRLWRTFCFTGERSRRLEFPPHFHFELLRRATAAEGGVEGIIVKLATERLLTPDDIRNLGLFRQAYQQLRQAIRDGSELDWINKTAAYDLYNELATATSSIVFSNKRPTKLPGYDEASLHLKSITSIRLEDWKAELTRRQTRMA